MGQYSNPYSRTVLEVSKHVPLNRLDAPVQPQPDLTLPLSPAEAPLRRAPSLCPSSTGRPSDSVQIPPQILHPAQMPPEALCGFSQTSTADLGNSWARLISLPFVCPLYRTPCYCAGWWWLRRTTCWKPYRMPFVPFIWERHTRITKTRTQFSLGGLGWSRDWKIEVLKACTRDYKNVVLVHDPGLIRRPSHNYFNIQTHILCLFISGECRAYMQAAEKTCIRPTQTNT